MVVGGGVTHTESDSLQVTKLNTGENEYFRLSRWNYEFTIKENLLEPPADDVERSDPRPTDHFLPRRRSGVYFDELVGVITENIPDGDRCEGCDVGRTRATVIEQGLKKNTR